MTQVRPPSHGWWDRYAAGQVADLRIGVCCGAGFRGGGMEDALRESFAEVSAGVEEGGILLNR
jgi:hypothetical protein